MLHAYLVTVTHPKHGDLCQVVDAADPMLAAEAAEWQAATILNAIHEVDRFFAYKVEPAPMCRRGRLLLDGSVQIEGQVE